MARLLGRLLLWAALLSTAAVALGLAALFLLFPRVSAAPELKVAGTPEQVDRGRYLAHHVAVCLDCHSERDWGLFAAPPVAGTWGEGGEVFDEEMGLPGAYYAGNITPSGIGGFSDGEVYRAITAGLGKDGRPLFPIMPYPEYGQLADQDLYAIIAYLRTLEPIEHEVPASHSDFPMSLIIRTLPREASERLSPSPQDPLAHGRYLTTAAGCLVCHTPQERGRPVPGKLGAGGLEFPLKTGGIVRSVNITFHEATGIGSFTRDYFVQRFKLHADPDYEPAEVLPGDLNTPMPWSLYAGMTEEDLAAIYVYLRSLPRIANRVPLFTPP